MPIMGRVTINGTIAQFSCKQAIQRTLWDAKGIRAKGKSKEAQAVNATLDNIKAQIAKHYQRISDRDAYVTAEMVRNAYQGIGTEYETLLRAFDKENGAFANPLKHIVTTAHYNGKIPRNPFAQYHVDPDFKEREYLTEKELRAFATVETPFLTGTSCCVAPISARNLRGNMDYILQTARITSSVSG